jgi:hypothetical protein
MVEPPLVFTVNQANLSQPAGPETLNIQNGLTTAVQPAAKIMSVHSFTNHVQDNMVT